MLIKHGAGKLKDEVRIKKNKATGVTKVASKPLPQAPVRSTGEKSDGEPA